MVVGAAVGLFGLPLFAQLVPRNALYGFRAAAMAQDDTVWYKINRVYGGGLFLSGALQFGVGALLHHLGAPTDPGIGLLVVLLLVLPLMAVYIWTMIYAHKTTHRIVSKDNSNSEDE